jgi:phosphoglycolate phosphatase-like HAD superfamily hydrolase
MTPMTKPISPAPDTVLFDVEGTLVDCVPQTLQSWHDVLARYGYEVPTQQLQRYSGMDTKDMLAELLPASLRPRADDIAAAQGEHCRKKYLPSVRGFAGVRELTQKLKRSGCRIGLATSCQPDELKVYVELTRIGDLIDATACGADAKKGKPHPDLLKAVLQRMNAAGSKSAIMVGDTPYDAQAAAALDLTALGVLCGGHPEADLRAAGCRAVYADPAQLLAQFAEAFSLQLGAR